MRAVNYLSLLAGAILMTGCASVEPVPSGPLSLSQVEKIGSDAERDLAANDLAAAGKGYARIVAAYPNNAPAWYRLGTIYLRTNQHNAAQYAFQESVRADPSLTKAYANLAIAHLGQFRSAARRALASDQVSAANKLTLTGLLEDAEHALAPPPFPATASAPAARQ